jgi:hypothetical protein
MFEPPCTPTIWKWLSHLYYAPIMVLGFTMVYHIYHRPRQESQSSTRWSPLAAQHSWSCIRTMRRCSLGGYPGGYPGVCLLITLTIRMIGSMHIYIYTCVYTHMCIYTYTYIYAYINKCRLMIINQWWSSINGDFASKSWGKQGSRPWGEAFQSNPFPYEKSSK